MAKQPVSEGARPSTVPDSSKRSNVSILQFEAMDVLYNEATFRRTCLLNQGTGKPNTLMDDALLTQLYKINTGAV